MELLFESRSNLTAFAGKLRFTQHRPRIHPTPVLKPDSPADGCGAAIYGSVHREQGLFRMWYQAIPRHYDFAKDIASVAYAESEDGIHWQKPSLGLVGTDKANNLTTLTLHAPSIVMDPASPEHQKYTATGCIKPDHALVKQGKPAGIYTAHSADGLRWTLSDQPHWPFTGDVSSSVYHTGRRQTLIALKYMPRRNGLVRRSISTATLTHGQASEPTPALVPDESADMTAQQFSGVTADYYGMGMLPAGKSSTVGFLWNYWHTLPYSPGPNGNGPVALYGYSDISLVYQEQTHALWQHMPGRQMFIQRKDIPWRCEWLYSASSVVEVDDEHRLYFTTFPFSHGRQLSENWKPDPALVAELQHEGYGQIAMASWPRWRLFGLFADPEGSLVIKLGKLNQPHRLRLNYVAGKNGCVRAAVLNDPHRSLEHAHPLTSDEVTATAAWKTSDLLLPSEDVRVQLHMHDATVYAYELIPAN